MTAPANPVHAESHRLVEHFFRHQHANVVASLTRQFGVAKLDLIEDAVGRAMLQAMNAWRKKGPPDKPVAWIHQVAKHTVLDQLRRDQLHAKAMAFAKLQVNRSGTTGNDQSVDQDFEETVSDSLLRMLFVCCHPELAWREQVCLALKILCGFSVNEIAAGLLENPETVKKRIQRAKPKLAELSPELELPASSELPSRLASVHRVLYLMFNEGYSTSENSQPIRAEICEESARLCHLICQRAEYADADSFALLALMLLHGARLDARVDASNCLILLEDQDRSQWDHRLIAIAHGYLDRSFDAAGGRDNRKVPTRFQLEAMLAHLHTSAPSVTDTDWKGIVRVYDLLLLHEKSDVYLLNRAIAVAQTGDVDSALVEIRNLKENHRLASYHLLLCGEAYIECLAGNYEKAYQCYSQAIPMTKSTSQRAIIEKRRDAVRGR